MVTAMPGRLYLAIHWATQTPRDFSAPMGCYRAFGKAEDVARYAAQSALDTLIVPCVFGRG